MNAIVFFDKNATYNKYKLHGTIKFHQCTPESPTKIIFNIQGFPNDKTRAIHIHEYGNLTEGCKSAGAHYNPYNKNHGCIFLNNIDRHAGDLINNITPSNGNVRLEYYDNLVSLFGEHSILGRTIVIHENKDDLGLGGNAESLKTGNAGDRVACFIIGVDKKRHL
jgi:Cu-Zn family superoxide dismutase